MRAMTLLVLLLALPQAAWAQLFEVSSANDPAALGFRAAAAYDPAHDCYLVVSSASQNNFALTGRFLSRAGATVGTLTIDPHPPFFSIVPAVAYSPDISDGAGGFGGFVVVWNSELSVVAQRVAFPGQLLGPRATIGVLRSGIVTKLGLAYSPTERVFLAVVASSRAIPTSRGLRSVSISICCRSGT